MRIYLALSLFLIGILHSQEAPTGTLPDEFQALIEQLKSDDAVARDAAAEKLVALGEQAQSAINEAIRKHNANLDLSSRLKQIAHKIQRGAILKYFESPRTLSWQAKEVTFKAALEKLKEHFGYSFEIDEENAKKTMDLDWKDLSYFGCLESIRRSGKFGYVYREDETSSGIPLQFVALGETGRCYTQQFGSYLLIVTNFGRQTDRDLDLNAGSTTETHYFTVSGFIVPLPGLPKATLLMSSTKLLDSKKIAAESEGVELDSEEGNAFNMHDYLFTESILDAPIDYEGELTVQIPIKIKKKRVPHLAAFVGKSIDTPIGAVKIVAAEGKRVTYETNSTMMQLIYTQRYFAEDKEPNTPGLYFLDSDGRIMHEDDSAENDGLEDGSLQTTLVFDRPPAQVVLLYVEEQVEKKYKLSIEGLPQP